MKELKKSITAVDIGIQKKQNKLTKTFMMILDWKTLWSPWFMHDISVF